MGSDNFTIKDLQSDFLVSDVLENITLLFHELDLAYADYSAVQMLKGEPVLSRLEWINA